MSTNFTDVQVEGFVLDETAVSTITTASAVTFTAAQIVGKMILRDPNGGGRSDLLPTVASLYTELGSPINAANASFDFVIRNTADAAETITLTTNTGWTLSGTMTIAQNNSKTFRVVFTSPTAATVYSLGTVVH